MGSWNPWLVPIPEPVRRTVFISFSRFDRTEVDHFVQRWTVQERVFIPKALGLSFGNDLINSDDADYVPRVDFPLDFSGPDCAAAKTLLVEPGVKAAGSEVPLQTLGQLCSIPVGVGNEDADFCRQSHWATASLSTENPRVAKASA